MPLKSNVSESGPLVDRLIFAAAQHDRAAIENAEQCVGVPLGGFAFGNPIRDFHQHAQAAATLRQVAELIGSPSRT